MKNFEFRPVSIGSALGTIAAAIIFGPLLLPAAGQNYVFHDLYTLGTPASFLPSGADAGTIAGVGPNGAMAGFGDSSRADLGGATTNTAAIWDISDPFGISLYPGEYAYGTDGTQQVGALLTSGLSVPEHAVLWTGSATSAVDLNPIQVVNGVTVSWVTSRAISVAGGQQVGWGEPTSGSVHALLWSGTAVSFVDLNPAGFSSSQAFSLGGGQQVGFGSIGGGNSHALLWTGSASSAVDLQPAGYEDSLAAGTDGWEQVGYGHDSNGSIHALLWTGSAESVVDLGSGQAIAVAAGKQAGFEGNQLTLWSGTAASAINLSALLPAGFGIATGFNPSANEGAPLFLDSSGDVFAVAEDITDNTLRAIEFTPTPEPSSVCLLALGLGSLVFIRDRRR